MQTGKKGISTIKALFLGALLSLFLSIDFSGAVLLDSPEPHALSERLLACWHTFGSTQVILPFLIGLLVYKAKESAGGKPSVSLSVTSCVFGLLNTLGQQMYHNDRLFSSLPGKAMMGCYAFSCAFVFYCAGALVLHHLHKLGSPSESPEPSCAPKKLFFLSFGIILAGWLPWMISYYPFSADWDVYFPIQQYLGMAPKTTHHPWFYCSSVGFFYQLGLLLGDKNVGIFLYVLLRALLMSALYSSLVVKLKKRGLKSIVCWGIILFYALVPVWGAYAKHGFKDTIICPLFCWFIVSLIETGECIGRGEINGKTFLDLGFSVLSISLFRNTGILVAVPVVLLLILSVIVSPRYHKAKLRVCAMLSLGVLLFGGYMIYIRTVEKVGPGPAIEALSIPLQQTARTVRDHENEITQEERDAIGNVLDIDQLGKRYNPLISDPIKGLSHFQMEYVPDYFRAWFSMFFKYPTAYVEAALGQSYGYYAFTGDQALHAGNWNCGMTIFDWVKDPRFTESFTCDYVEAFAGIRFFLDEWAKIWHQIPLLNLTDTKAVYTWFIILIGVLMIQKKRLTALIPIFGFVLMILSCCASPVNDCFRYFGPAAAAAPACLMLVFPNLQKKE